LPLLFGRVGRRLEPLAFDLDGRGGRGPVCFERGRCRLGLPFERLQFGLESRGLVLGLAFRVDL
jgi:hypothetical protein